MSWLLNGAGLVLGRELGSLAAVFARVIWLLAAVGLGAGTWLAWQYRFVEVPGAVRLRLGPELRESFHAARAPGQIEWTVDARSFRITASPAREFPTYECSLARLPPSQHAWIRIEAACDQLRKGDNYWDDARAMVLWKDSHGRITGRHAPLFSIDGTVGVSVFEVAVPLRRTAIPPVIAFQNLGSAGVVTVHSMEVRAVNDRRWFRPLMGGLALAWVAWAAFAIARWLAPAAQRTRQVVAAVAWVGLGSFFLFPGPWFPLRPLCQPFRIATGDGGVVGPGSPEGAAAGPRSSGAAVAARAAAGEILLKPRPGSDPVSLLFWLKRHIRPLLHVGAFAGIAVGFCVLLGTRRGWVPVVLLGGGSELMQWLWGYGFGWEDVLDLAINGLGIGVGVVVAKRLLRRLRQAGKSS